MSAQSKRLDKYLGSQASQCLFCGGADIRSEPPLTADLAIHCEVVCENCGKTWTDVYTVTSVIEPEPEKKDEDRKSRRKG